MQNKIFEDYIAKGKSLKTIVDTWEFYQKSKTPINIHSNNEKPFITACKNGLIYIAKWLMEISKKIDSIIDVNINNDEAFRVSCTNGHINIVKWLTDNFNINLHAKNEDAFVSSCKSGHFDIVKFLWEISNGTIDIHLQNESAFRWGCYNENLDIIVWLVNLSYEIKSPIDIHINDEEVFRNCCYIGNYKIIKFLLEFSKQMKEPINIRINDDYGLKVCCRNEYFNLAKLLCCYCDNYKIYSKNNKKFDYVIYSDEDVMIKAIALYNKIWLNKNDINLLKKLFTENKKYEDEVCTVCYSKQDSPQINFKCKINDKIYDHCCCLECFAKWYIIKQKEKKCLCCYSNINLKECVLIIPTINK